MPPQAPVSSRSLWLDGQLVPWDTATIHLTALGSLHNISTVGEGIQAYHNSDIDTLFIFRLRDHMQRLDDSMKLQRMQRLWMPDQLAQAAVELLQANGLENDTHISPRAFFDPTAPWGANLFVEDPGTTQVMIHAGPRPTRLRDPKPVHCCVSSWARISDNVIPPRIKCLSNYQNCRLAAWEAHLNGYDEAIMLDNRGKVTEAPSACLFIVRSGVAITPRVTDSVLESITRRTFLDLFRDELGIQAIEREIDRTELYLAEEAFLCGTSAEIQPIVSIDRHALGDGCPGPITEAIRGLYYDIVCGRNSRYLHWLTKVV